MATCLVHCRALWRRGGDSAPGYQSGAVLIPTLYRLVASAEWLRNTGQKAPCSHATRTQTWGVGGGTGAVSPSHYSNGKSGRSPSPAPPTRACAPRHSIRALGAPAISLGAASRSRPPFCGGVPLANTLAHGGCPPTAVRPGLRCPSPPAGRTTPRARPGTAPAQGRAAAAPPPPAGHRPPAAPGPWSRCRQGPHH